jgi:hypothetical protein
MDTWLTPTRDEAATGRFCAGKSIARFGFYSPRRETAGFHVLVFLNEGFRVNVAGTRKSPDRFLLAQLSVSRSKAGRGIPH